MPAAMLQIPLGLKGKIVIGNWYKANKFRTFTKPHFQTITYRPLLAAYSLLFRNTNVAFDFLIICRLLTYNFVYIKKNENVNFAFSFI